MIPLLSSIVLQLVYSEEIPCPTVKTESKYFYCQQLNLVAMTWMVQHTHGTQHRQYAISSCYTIYIQHMELI